MRIAIKRSDGGVTVLDVPHGHDPAAAVIGWEGGVKDRGWTAVSWRETTEDQLPPREFRNAFEFDPKHGFVVNMEKARNIRRDQLRELRAPLLAALDVEYQRADEAGDAKAKKAISAKKQALRDVTKSPEIEAAKTPSDLGRIQL